VVTVTAVPNAYSIGGTVSLNGVGQAGVVVALTGSTASATTTAADGSYLFAGLPAGGSYTLTPARNGYGFTPATYTVTSISGNVTGENFTEAAAIAAVVDIASATQQAAANTEYLANDGATLVTITLPPSSALSVGDIVRVTGIGSGGWVVAPNTSPQQSIDLSSFPSTGAGIKTTGTINGQQYSVIDLVYAGNNTFTIMDLSANIAANGYVYAGGLTWMPTSNSAFLPWIDSGGVGTGANSYCNSKTINGLTGWRLPTKAEMLGLYAVYPNNSSVLSAQGWIWLSPWSSTPDGAGSYDIVSLINGGSFATSGTISDYVTCVR